MSLNLAEGGAKAGGKFFEGVAAAHCNLLAYVDDIPLLYIHIRRIRRTYKAYKEI